MICNNCGSKITDNSKFCYKCGNKTTSKQNNKFKSTQKLCNRCGSKINSDDVFCCNCGNNVGGVNSDETNTYTTENNILKNSTQSNNISNIKNNPKQSIDKPIKNLQNVSSQNATQPFKTTKQQANFKNDLIGYILLIIITFIVCIAILVLIGVDIYATNNTNADELQLTKMYTNKEDGINFRYPEGWSKDEALSNQAKLFFI